MSGDALDVIYTPLYWCNSAICVTHTLWTVHAYMNHMHSLKHADNLPGLVLGPVKYSRTSTTVLTGFLDVGW